MRLSIEEILQKYPSFNNKHVDTLVERYYGDLPQYYLQYKKETNNSTINNLNAIPNFIASNYGDNNVGYYNTSYGEGYILQNGIILNSLLNITYKRMKYSICLFNNYLNSINGFYIYKNYSGDYKISACWSSEEFKRLLPTKHIKSELDLDIIKTLLSLDIKKHNLGLLYTKTCECILDNFLQEKSV